MYVLHHSPRRLQARYDAKISVLAKHLAALVGFASHNFTLALDLTSTSIIAYLSILLQNVSEPASRPFKYSSPFHSHEMAGRISAPGTVTAHDVSPPP